MRSGKSKYAILFLSIACFINCKEKQTQKSVEAASLRDPDTLVLKRAETAIDEMSQDSLSYRDQNWRPERGQYYFSESYHFEYYNETISPEEGAAKGEFGFYVDPESGTILLEKHIANYADEMTDYIIIHPDKRYTVGYTDEFGNQKTVRESLVDVEGLTEKIKYGTDDFMAFFKIMDETKTFGANKYYPKKLESQGYQRNYTMTKDTVSLFMAKTDQPTRALYLVGEVFSELGMPVRQDYGFVIPEGFLVTKEHYETVSDKRIGFKLTAIMAAEYHIQLP